ncbi:MAG: hypothetical protein ICV85_20425 [Tolypothrix sp. T3-bin4]|nr:hypothetical protein [Tolypothrix sp. T3-bin4]
MITWDIIFTNSDIILSREGKQGICSFIDHPFHQTQKNLPASLQVTGLEPTLKRKNRPNCQLVYHQNNFSWGDFSGGWQIFRWY